MEVASLVATNAGRPTPEGHRLFFKYKRVKIRPIVMDPQPDNSTGNAQRASTGRSTDRQNSKHRHPPTKSHNRRHAAAAGDDSTAMTKGETANDGIIGFGSPRSDRRVTGQKWKQRLPLKTQMETLRQVSRGDE